MLINLLFKGNLAQFRTLITNFDTFDHLEYGLKGRPRYEIEKKDINQVRVRFRDHAKRATWPEGEWGTILAETTGDPSIIHLTVYAHESIWNDLEGAWDALRKTMIERRYIDPDTTTPPPKEAGKQAKYVVETDSRAPAYADKDALSTLVYYMKQHHGKTIQFWCDKVRNISPRACSDHKKRGLLLTAEQFESRMAESIQNAARRVLNEEWY